MMSYLWILLLGSLLATSAKAQDVEAPTEEQAASESPALEADTATEVDEESAADKETEHAAEEILPTTGEPEHKAEASEPGTPVVEEAEPVDTPAADADAEAEAGAEAGAEAEPGTDAGAGAVAEPGTEAGTEAGAGAEAEAEATTTKQVDLEVVDPKAEEPTVLGEEEATSSIGETPAQESESEATPAADPAVADNEEKPTVPAAADAEPTQPAVEPEVEVPVTTIKVEMIVPEVNADVKFNLLDALPEENAVDSPGQTRSFESGPHVAGANGEADKPEAQEAGSGSIAAILSGIAVSVGAAIVGFFTYKKKKLCFKNRQEADPEAARKADATEAQSDPQVLSNLLKSS